VRALNWAFEQTEVPPGPRLTLLALAKFADGDGHCYPGRKRLAELSGHCERTINNHLMWLELMRAIQDNRRAQLTDVGRAALAAIGGSWALQHEPTDRLRRTWVSSYVAAGRAHRLQLLDRALPAGTRRAAPGTDAAS